MTGRAITLDHGDLHVTVEGRETDSFGQLHKELNRVVNESITRDPNLHMETGVSDERDQEASG